MQSHNEIHTLWKVIDRLEKGGIPYMKMSDTTPEMQKYYDDLWRNLSIEERFIKGLQWIEFNRDLFIAGLRARNPHLNELALYNELRRELYSI